METILGVQQNEKVRSGMRDTDVDPLRYDVDQADALDQEERRRARQRYQYMYWDSIPEGELVKSTLPFLSLLHRKSNLHVHCLRNLSCQAFSRTRGRSLTNPTQWTKRRNLIRLTSITF